MLLGLLRRICYKAIAPALMVLGVVLLCTLYNISYLTILVRLQELSLFLPTKLYFMSCMKYPGGALSWLGTYMMQYYYHPSVGIWLLCLTLCCIVFIMKFLCRLHGAWMLLGLGPALALITNIFMTGWWMYYQKLQGYSWVPTLGILFSLLLAVPACFMKGRLRSAYIVVLCVVAYPLMGAWSFVAVWLVCLLRYGDATLKQQMKYILIGTCACIMVPMVYYGFVYTQTMLPCMYTAALPCYAITKCEFQEFRVMLCLIPLSMVPMLAVRWFGVKSQVLGWICSIVYVGLFVWIYVENRYVETNFVKECRMMECIENEDWPGVLTAMRDNKGLKPMPPTRLMVMEKNLALFRMGRIGDDIFKYPEGSTQYCVCGRECKVETVAGEDTIVHVKDGLWTKHKVYPVRITQTGGKMIYYHYGKEQFCYRWCMEDGVEYGWTVHDLKYMTKASLVAGEWEVARKYLDLLAMTKYHREWADKYRKFLYQEELMSADEEFRPIMPMSVFVDRLDGDKTMVELYLQRTFASGMGSDIYYQEMSLVFAMLSRDIDLFWPRFRQYVNMHHEDDGFYVPKAYQEAAYLYSMLEPQKESVLWPGMTNAEAMQYLPFDSDVKSRYDDFMNFNGQCGPMSDEQKAIAFRPQYGDTFYYYYFLVRNQKTN